jgi:3-hydroxyacyl-CoA dehydrogenase / 3-hydroxy-2-methylbutyryl-CoA dehydrogenase
VITCECHYGYYKTNYSISASGLGQAAVEEICANGGNVALLDLNEELGAEVVKLLPKDAGKFFVCDVSETESIAAAVTGIVEWIEKTGKPMGGIIPAAGVGNPSTVLNFRYPSVPISEYVN